MVRILGPYNKSKKCEQRLCIDGLPSFHFIKLTHFDYVTAPRGQATRLPFMAAAAVLADNQSANIF
jgi:hypothetical protein